MSEIDVRTSGVVVDQIRFSDQEWDGMGAADVLKNCGPDEVQIRETANSDYVRVYDRKHAENLIKALEKAIDLGWLR